MDEEKSQQSEADLHSDEINRYAECMREIMYRLRFLKDRIALGSNNDNKLIDTEIICYQFRAIIELILLSSLAAHKKYYIENLRKISGLWKIERIIKVLNKKNPQFYPAPIKEPIINTEAQTVSVSMAPLESTFLTLPDAITIYNNCSNYLHSKNPFAMPKDYKVWEMFPTWYSKITNLLHWHIVNMFNTKKGLLVNLDFQSAIPEKQVKIMYLKNTGKEVH